MNSTILIQIEKQNLAQSTYFHTENNIDLLKFHNLLANVGGFQLHLWTKKGKLHKMSVVLSSTTKMGQ